MEAHYSLQTKSRSFPVTWCRKTAPEKPGEFVPSGKRHLWLLLHTDTANVEKIWVKSVSWIKMNSLNDNNDNNN